MFDKGQKIRGKDGRIIEIIAPVMTEPVSYFVRFLDTNEEKVVNIKQPVPATKTQNSESIVDSVMGTVYGIMDEITEEMHNLRNSFRKK